MARTDDFGDRSDSDRSDSSQTAEDATLHGQPVEDAPGLGGASSADPDLAGSPANEDEAEAMDPVRTGEIE